MILRFALLMVCAWSSALSGAEDIAVNAASPYDVARFVETHSNFEWGPLWNALHLTSDSIFLPACEESFPGVRPCSSELITVAGPLQAIVVLEHKGSGFQVFLRYQRVGLDGWKFAGAWSPHVKYFQPAHRIKRFGSKPFLIVTGEGGTGSGLSTKVESWVDLTRKEFEPVLDFTSEGDVVAYQNRVGRAMHGFVVALETKPVESITVEFDIEFQAVKGTHFEVPIGRRRDRVIYVRTSSGKFELDRSRSSASDEEVGDFYDDLDSTVTNDEFLRFNLKGLEHIATSSNSEARTWLAEFLKTSPDTRESRGLKTLLAKTR